MNRDLPRSGEIVGHRCEVCGDPASKYIQGRETNYRRLPLIGWVPGKWRPIFRFYCNIHGPDKNLGMNPVPLEQRRVK